MKNLWVISFLWIGILNVQAQNWILLNDYFPVYTYSELTQGLTIELHYTTLTQNEIVDSVFDRLAKLDSFLLVPFQEVKNCIPVDTNGRFKFYRNLNLEKHLLTGINKSLFVYCTKGVIERTIKDVVFALDDCKSNIVVFRFDKIDYAKFGHPILCTQTKLPLQLGNFATATKEIQTLEQNYNVEYYKDSAKAIAFAKMDSLYFAFADSFNWNDLAQNENFSWFPGRAVYVKRKDGRIYRKWNLYLDLFGIPCD